MRNRRGFSGNAAPIGVHSLLKAMPWPCTCEDILSGVDITISDIAAKRTHMSTYRQTLLHNLTACVAVLRGEARIDSDHSVTSSSSLLFKDLEKCAPTGVKDALCQGMIVDHVEKTQVLNRNDLIAFCIRRCRLKVEVTALPLDLEMGLRCTASSLALSVTALCTPGQLALLAPQGFLRGAIEARVLYCVAFAVSEKGRETNVNADSRMMAVIWRMLGLWLRLTDDECVPVSIRPMHQVRSLGFTLESTVHLDLEGCADLSRDMQMLVISIQPHIAAGAVLSELERMPTVRLLETRETHIRNTHLSGLEKPFKRFREAISQHLNRGGWYILTTTAFELCRQIVLRWERALLCILRLNGLEHLVIDMSRLSQTSHQQARLVLIRIQSKLKRSHILLIAMRERNVNSLVPPTHCGNSPSCLKAVALLPHLGRDRDEDGACDRPRAWVGLSCLDAKAVDYFSCTGGGSLN